MSGTSDLQRLIDEGAIRDLAAAYSDAVTHLDAVRAAAVYAEDGCVVVMGRETRGRAAIEQGMRETFAAFELLQLIAHAPQISLDGDTAQARWSTVELTVRRGAAHFGVIMGRYEDRLVREGSVWRFRERVFTMAGRMQMPIDKLQTHAGFFGLG